MDFVTGNVIRHVYEALQGRKRAADTGNVSNVQSFYNRLISEYGASDKKNTSIVVPLTGQDVEDFYSGKMTRDGFVDTVRSKMVSKLVHYDPNVLNKISWEWYCGSHDFICSKLLQVISQQSAILLWLLFNKLVTHGSLIIHAQDAVKVITHLYTHLRANVDQSTIESWMTGLVGNSSAGLDFWTFLTVTVEKVLAPRGAQAATRAIQSLYEEVVEEVIKCGQMTKKGHRRHTWKMRWFVLTATDLHYYESKEILLKKGSVVLNHRAHVEVMQDKNEKDTRYPNRFKVVDGVNGTFTEISAENLAQMNEWVEAIKMAITLNSVIGRNYLHKLQIARGKVTEDVDQSSVVTSFSSQSLDTVADLLTASDGASSNKINRKISCPIMPSSPPPVINQREALSENSSLTDLYASVDKTKKSSVPGFSTRPVRVHDYEDVDGDNLPPKVPPPYRGDMDLSVTVMSGLHSNSVDHSTDVFSDRGGDVALRSSSRGDGLHKRHSSYVDEDEFTKTLLAGRDMAKKRSFSPDVNSVSAGTLDLSRGKHDRGATPPALPVKTRSPMLSRRQEAIDVPPSLPPKSNIQSQLVDYAEVQPNRTTVLAVPRGKDAKNKDPSYADLDFAQLPNPSGSSSSTPPVDHMKRDYADIDFSSTHRLEKSILGQDTSTTSAVKLPPKPPPHSSKMNGSVEDKSGYVTVDFPNNTQPKDSRNSAPRQMMVVQPQAYRQPPIKKNSSTDNNLNFTKPVASPRAVTQPPSLPPKSDHLANNPPPLPPKLH